MKKILIASVVCVLLSLIPLNVSDSTLTIIYGIIGVLFSVGMSLIISFNGSNIRNAELKKEIRDNMHNVRRNFLSVFLFSSFFFVIYSVMPKDLKQIEWYKTEGIVLKSDWSFSVISYHLYSIVALISNYLDIQKLYEDIEDRIDYENKKKNYQ